MARRGYSEGGSYHDFACFLFGLICDMIRWLMKRRGGEVVALRIIPTVFCYPCFAWLGGFDVVA